jgi:hypothetical protein
MPELSLNETQLKDLMKAAVLEIFEERRDLFQELIAEALEDIAMIKAIDEGKDSEPVSRDAIFAILEQPEWRLNLEKPLKKTWESYEKKHCWIKFATRLKPWNQHRRSMKLLMSRSSKARMGTFVFVSAIIVLACFYKKTQFSLSGWCTVGSFIAIFHKAQLDAIRDLLRTPPGNWTAKQIAAQFKGRTTQKKLDEIAENLERLEWFGRVILAHRDDLAPWHYTDAAKQRA